MLSVLLETRSGQTDRQTDRPTDIVTYRAAIAAKNGYVASLMYL